MKEISILVNGKYIIKADKDYKIFLYADETSFMIHLIEETNDTFKKRIEIKKAANDDNKYISFCYHLNSYFVYSGYITISENNLIIGDINFQILEQGKTSIIEGYYLTISFTDYYLEHIITKNINRELLYTNKNSTITIFNMDAFLFNIINLINNRQSTKNEVLIPQIPSFSHILSEEKNILEYIKSLEAHPELEDFLKKYYNKYNRKRTIK